MTATDPRFDVETKQHWDTLIQQLRIAIADLDAPEPVKTALADVLDLHCAWERREQVFSGRSGRYSHDVVHGVGCRSCDFLPSPAVVPIERRHCQTVESLRRALLPDQSDPPADPWSTRAQMRAWDQGWTAAKIGGIPQNPYRGA